MKGVLHPPVRRSPPRSLCVLALTSFIATCHGLDVLEWTLTQDRVEQEAGEGLQGSNSAFGVSCAVSVGTPVQETQTPSAIASDGFLTLYHVSHCLPLKQRHSGSWSNVAGGDSWTSKPDEGLPVFIDSNFQPWAMKDEGISSLNR